MLIVHLTASTFHGGPERQMLGLAGSLPEEDRSVFLSFAEGGRCRPFLSVARREGFEAYGLENDTPRFRAAVREIAGHLERLRADVLCCHGYKADLLGRRAARRQNVPVVAVSRGWTGECFKVRVYEALDRCCLRWMDRVVCVSQAQARRVYRAGVRPARVRVIPNAVDPERFTDPEAHYRTKLLRYFRQPRTHVVGAAGRLSPEKGFDVLVAAAARVVKADPSVGFVVFGDGPERAKLSQQINAAGLAGSFVLSGFRADLDRFMPFFDLLALPSFTEGMPNVVLEAFAAGVPVVASAVGGTPEIVEDGQSGFLVPPRDPVALAARITEALAAEDRLRDMGLHGRQRVLDEFSFAAQAEQYRLLFEELAIRTDAAAAAEESVPGKTTATEDAAPPTPEAGEAEAAGHLIATEPTCEP
jgi:glycosyltransferase involved in cell wall biosynthesis